MHVEVTSAHGGKQRWTKLAVDVTPAGYALTVTGCSTLPSEVALVRRSTHPTATGLIAKLRRPDGGISRLACSLLEELARHDDEVREATMEEGL